MAAALGRTAGFGLFSVLISRGLRSSGRHHHLRRRVRRGRTSRSSPRARCRSRISSRALLFPLGLLGCG